jgi:hypothetical protein
MTPKWLTDEPIASNKIDENVDLEAERRKLQQELNQLWEEDK